MVSDVDLLDSFSQAVISVVESVGPAGAGVSGVATGILITPTASPLPTTHAPSPLSPGESGGPFADPGGQGVGFKPRSPPVAQRFSSPVPSHTARRVISVLIRAGHVGRSYLGTTGETWPINGRVNRYFHLEQDSG